MLRVLPTLLLLLSPLAAPAQTTDAAAAEQHQRVVAIAHKLEATPLDQALFPEREWAKQWVIQNPDVRIRMCMQLLPDLRRPRYKFRAEILDQMMLSSAAFLIEHPDKTGDHLAENVGGLQGVLKAYSAIVKINPDARVQALDDMLERQSRGKLAEFARETIKACQF
ncbi:MAG TPA: hypothetical protein VFQ41_26380 [Candidatus Angelobacter sp.]|nr:hypothetical protein [Candidatus Angelobacter sp.]